MAGRRGPGRRPVCQLGTLRGLLAPPIAVAAVGGRCPETCPCDRGRKGYALRVGELERSGGGPGAHSWTIPHQLATAPGPKVPAGGWREAQSDRTEVPDFMSIRYVTVAMMGVDDPTNAPSGSTSTLATRRASRGGMSRRGARSAARVSASVQNRPIRSQCQRGPRPVGSVPADHPDRPGRYSSFARHHLEPGSGANHLRVCPQSGCGPPMTRHRVRTSFPVRHGACGRGGKVILTPSQAQ